MIKSKKGNGDHYEKEKKKNQATDLFPVGMYVIDIQYGITSYESGYYGKICP